MDFGSRLSRRKFLKTTILAATGLAAGCTAPLPVDLPWADGTSSEEPLPTATPYEPKVHLATPPAPPTRTLSVATPTATRVFKPTRTPTHTPTPTVTPTDERRNEFRNPLPTSTSTSPATSTPLVAKLNRADLMAHYPQVSKSVVSVVHHGGVWNGDHIQSAVVLEMLDAALTQLTGLTDALLAWKVLFDPGEVVGIKVNTISRYTTTPEVAYAVAQRLQDAGIPPEQIVIFDRTDRELVDRGFALNAEGPGVRCRGAKGWEQPSDVAGSTQRIHDVMLSCHALINIPVIKEHGTSGFTSSLKNHYGTVDQPGQLHGGNCNPYIAALNALPVIRDKTRLIVCDALRTCPYDWNQMIKENLIMMSFDPVANDTLARQVLLDRQEADNRKKQYIVDRSAYLDTAVQMGLGADVAHVEERRMVLG